MKHNRLSEYLRRGSDCPTVWNTKAFPVLGSQSWRPQGGKDITEIH